MVQYIILYQGQGQSKFIRVIALSIKRSGSWLFGVHLGWWSKTILEVGLVAYQMKGHKE